MDSQTEMRSTSSIHGEQIPLVVNEEPNDNLFTLVNSLKCISSDIEYIKDYLETTNEQYQTVSVLKETVGHLVRQNNWLCESMKAMKKDVRTLRDKQTSSQSVERQKNRNDRAKGHTSASRQALSHSVHMEEALQENFIKFVEELSFGNTSIPDRLIDFECLSEDECASLRSKQGKDQVRCLLHKLMGRGPEKMTHFLQILEDHNYEYLTKGVYNSLERIKQEYKDSKTGCLVCNIKKNVDLRDISDHLFHKKMIKKEIYGAILEPSTLHAQRDFLWSNIFDGVNKAESIECAIGHLKEALKGKYNYLIEQFDIQTLQCLCHVRNRPLRRRKKPISEGGSQTDLSTTSDISKLSQIKQNINHSEADSMSVSSSMDLGTSFANLKPYLNIRQAGLRDSRTQDSAELSVHSDQRIRHQSGKFDIGDQTELIPDCKRQQSVSYVEYYESGIRPELQKSVSVITAATIRPKTSTESEDFFPDLNAELSPDLDSSDIPQNSINMDPGGSSPNEMLKVKEGHDKPMDLLHDTAKSITIQQLSKTSRSQEDDSSNDDEDKAFPNRKQTISRRLLRNKKHHRAIVLTKSRTESAPSKQYERRCHMKKKSRQRLERRERKLQQYESEEPYDSVARKSSHNPRQRKGPYNPTWLTHVQKPNTSNWDYNQARRHWLMSHRIANANRQNTDTDMNESFTEGSDTLG